jgi:hypothetical protein
LIKKNVHSQTKFSPMKYFTGLFPLLVFLFAASTAYPTEISSPGLPSAARDTFKSTLPLIKINTNGQGIPDEPKIGVDLGVIDHGKGHTSTPFDSCNDYHGLTGIEIRGSSSQMFEKKSYGFKTWSAFGVDTSVSILGLPRENDWVLYAPYSDKSLIRNALTYYLFGRFGHYSPRTRFCELFLNEDYRGLYLLIEKVKRDKNRVNIAKLKETDISGLPLTGGYILKLDKSTGSGTVDGFFSHYLPQTGGATPYFMFDYPDGNKINTVQRNYISGKVDQFESTLNGTNYRDPINGYRSLIDVPSFVDYFIINELSKNVDGFRLSTYIYKDRDDHDPKFHAGPVWDYDLAFGNANYSNAELTTDWQYQTDGGSWPVPFWWERLLSDPWFTGVLRCRWEGLRQGVLQNDTILAVIDNMVNEIRDAADRNFKLYPILGTYVWPNPYVWDTYNYEIFYLKGWVLDRMIYLDRFMPGTCVLSGTAGHPETESFHAVIFPNPSRDFAHLDIQNYARKELRLIVYDMTGQEVYHKELGSDDQLSANVPLHPGMYQLMVTDGKEYVTLKAIVN